MPEIRLFVGDTLPAASDTLIGADGKPADLTGTTIRFKGHRNGVLTINGLAQIAPNTTPGQGKVVYYWSTADAVLTHVGWHECHWEVTDQAGNVTSYPTDKSDPLRLQICVY